MKTLPVAAAALAATVTALAARAQEPWEGNWAAEPEWCQYADRIGSHDPAPIRLSAQSLDGYENSCAVTEVAGGEFGWWSLTLSCQGEGESYDDNRLILLAEPDVLWMFFGAGDPIRFSRCGG